MAPPAVPHRLQQFTGEQDDVVLHMSADTVEEYNKVLEVA